MKSLNLYDKVLAGDFRAHGIPDELVYNWDQTGINLVPGEN